ncbi:LysR family transcriptional regulator, partial [Salmonella enterica subsp. enterica serovar Infantis]
EAFFSCVLGGLGVILVLRPSLSPFIASGELTDIITDLPNTPKPLSLLYKDPLNMAPKLRVFKHWL